jgi:hypothetical protein
VQKTVITLVLLALCPLLMAQDAMNNDSVIKLVKAGMSDTLIISSINSKAGNYDTSADGMIALKTAGVSDQVISAMVSKASGAAAPAAATGTSGSGLPPGIDEVGVYYKDRSGAWVALMPEVVNFKSGGFMKSLATDGLVKQDTNGHLPGPHAKTIITLPVVMAVYVPEGVAITEYQLLRLRPSGGNSREFRSTTGGVFHSSGGASRDLVQFESTKIAPRVYQITLKQDAGKGEYGLIPPGSVSTSNLASGGKIYTVSVPE